MWENLSSTISKRVIIVFSLVAIPLSLFYGMRGDNPPSWWALLCICTDLFLSSIFLTASLRAKKDLDLSKIAAWKVNLLGSPKFSIILAFVTLLISYALQIAMRNFWITMIRIVLAAVVYSWQERIIMKVLNAKESPLSLLNLW
jgi:hypothetical protein